jgi:hypothetical protein
MVVLYDFKSEKIVSISAAVTSHTHTATIANVRGVAVGFVHGLTSLDTITNVSYGGVNLVRIVRGEDSATEPGVAEWWVSPTIPSSGQQTVHYSSSVPASDMFVAVITFTGAGHVYALSSQVEVENTTSHSVSLTTGYVSGYGLGALFWGGATPTSISFGTSPTIQSDGRWDMGAYGALVMRTIDATAAGSGPLLDFGGQQPGSDDIAFAAIFLTDGGINPGVGAVSIAGLAPTVSSGESVEGTALPGVGLVTAAGQIPGEYRELKQTVGLGGIGCVGQAPGELITLNQGCGVGLITTAGLIPELLRLTNVLPGVGLVTTVGQIPDEHRELKQGVGLGEIGCVGQVPGEHTTLNQSCGVGLAGTVGHVPALLRDGALGPEQGLLTLSGLAPALYTELKQDVGVGLAITEGRLPTVSGGGEVLGTAEPGVGLVATGTLAPALGAELILEVGVGLATTEGQVPTAAGDAEVPRGHVRTRDYGRAYIPETSETAAVSVVVAPPPPVFVDPPHSSFVVDTTAAQAKVSRLEARRARIARMRREEEELIAILMRAA